MSTWGDYTLIQNETQQKGNMGKNFDKFRLLMWKNWVLQYRKPIQTVIEIIAPVLFSFLLVIIRSLSDPELHDTQIYPAFCPFPIGIRNPIMNGEDICQNVDNISDVPNTIITNNTGNKMNMVYSPSSLAIDFVMDFFTPFFNVHGVENAHALETYFATNATNSTFAGIQFDDSYRNTKNLSEINDLKVSIRFPGETRFAMDPLGVNNWRTNLIYPIFQVAGPRMYEKQTGGAPSYFKEGFLGLQYFLTAALISARNNNSTLEKDNITDIISNLAKQGFPLIYMRRFPYSEWYEDLLLTPLKSMIGIIFMLSFVYTCINTVKTITTEKEKQLKEAMKIMGLPSWLHWTAWFVKCFTFLLISAFLMVILLKVKWYKNTDFTVFTHANPILLFIFLMFYTIATITFCFAISVFFSKANTAATIAGLAWFMSYAPYLFLQENYDSLPLGSKLLASLGSNTAMAFGFQIMLMYEGTGEGIQFDNVFNSNSPDDSLTLGLIIVMLIVDSIIYLLIALYVEKVFPGEYGVPLPWYFPFTKSFWCGHPYYIGIEDKHLDSQTINEGGIFEEEPRNLDAGVRISNLSKVFGSKIAVRDLSLNMFQDQITVLLGHNGAGKTTTMSMLIGMITPSSGTARINGFDIRTNIEEVRNSLGLCPQHNIIFDELTVSEHIYFFSKLKGLSNNQTKDEIEKFLNLLELTDKRDAKSSTLSGGMKRKLCVGMALCGDSKVVMLDEPTAGMDPSARRALWNLLQSQKEGRTVLLSTHFMDEADLLGDRIAIMAGGELQCCGSSFFLKKKYGAGYGLVLDKGPECDVAQVTQLLGSFIPDIEIQGNSGSELTYLLTENRAGVFEPMLKQLEENSERLDIRSYGISLTTLEEVFMKVGADHSQEEMYNSVAPTENGIKNEKAANGIKSLADGGKMDVAMSPNYTGGIELVGNQFVAMLLKKAVSTVRSWILLAVQIGMPTLFLIIAMVVSRNQKRTGNLPAMPLDLARFSDPVTLVQDDGTATNSYSGYYADVMRKYGNSIEKVDNITEQMLKLSKDVPNTVRRRYIIGASFEQSSWNVPNITAWFNNDPYHSPAISLSMVLNAVYRKFYENSTIRFVNEPLPYTVDTQLKQILSGQTMGFQLAFNIGFSMAFVSSFYVLFVVRENVSKSKHLQIVSGVKVYLFWLTSLLCDILTYLLTIAVLLITLVCFQEDGYRSSEEIGRMFVILLYFGWAFLPMLYLAGYFFDVPSTGFTRMTLLSIVTGNAAFLVVQVLSTPGLDLEHIGKGLHWAFLLFPHYSLSTGINDASKVFMYNKLCSNLFDACAAMNISAADCLKSQTNQQIISICSDLDNDYFGWAAPGIGRNLLYSLLTGMALLVLLLLIEYEVFSALTYFVEQKLFAKEPTDVADEDSDVAREKEKIRSATETDLGGEYVLAVRDLTKYYNKLLAVNGICLGVKKYECFGLLGVNGAGKTTTFKMMSGDVKMSHGDGWVNGNSIKRQLKRVQKVIGYCPQFDALLDDMTAKETIRMFALLRGIRYGSTEKVAEYLAREFDFLRHLNKKVKELSGGNKRKLSTAISLIGDPPVLFLDEPTTGMDPATKRYLWNALCKIRERGKSIVLTSHSMEECEALCTRLAIMVNGNFKCLGSTQHLKNKFAEGYTLTIKVKKSPSSHTSETGSIERFIGEQFPSAKLREKHQELLDYYIVDKTVPWSRMFGILEEGKRRDLNIEDYSLGQSSLEQVFLTFTKYQN